MGSASVWKFESMTPSHTEPLRYSVRSERKTTDMVPITNKETVWRIFDKTTTSLIIRWFCSLFLPTFACPQGNNHRSDAGGWRFPRCPPPPAVRPAWSPPQRFGGWWPRAFEATAAGRGLQVAICSQPLPEQEARGEWFGRPLLLKHPRVVRRIQ